MNKYQFRTLCANKEVCEDVKNIMKSMGFQTIIDADNRRTFDHTGIIEAENSNLVLEIDKELRIRAKEKLRNNEISLITQNS